MLVERPLVPALAGAVLLWGAFPPLAFWPLAWLATAPWLLLVLLPRPSRPRVLWRAVWAGGCLWWVLMLHGLVLAHWLNYIGLVLLAGYLALFTVLFVCSTRVLVHRLGWPLWLAAPITWCGIELLRGYGPLGLSLGLLAHSQVRWLPLIQVVDIAGSYTLSWLILLATSVWVQGLWRKRVPVVGVAVAVVAVAAALAYGWFRLSHRHGPASPTLRVAIIQGSIDTTFGDQQETWERMAAQYRELTLQACQQYPQLDLILWPESMFPLWNVVLEGGSGAMPAGLTLDQARQLAERFQQECRAAAQWFREENGQPAASSYPMFLFGTSVWHVGGPKVRRYNAAILVNAQGDMVGRYYKMHPVMFGEYLPFGEWFPWLYRWTPIPDGLTAGQQPVAFDVRGVRISPSICFESLMPHLIRHQVVTLAEQGHDPQVLVNLTNDGWFWGSSLLDLHLYCAVFRAVENRRPMLVAANTGLSAWIDPTGRIRARGPRRQTAVLLAEVSPGGGVPLYHRWGDLPAQACLLLVVAAVVWGGVSVWRERLQQECPLTVLDGSEGPGSGGLGEECRICGGLAPPRQGQAGNSLTLGKWRNYTGCAPHDAQVLRGDGSSRCRFGTGPRRLDQGSRPVG